MFAKRLRSLEQPVTLCVVDDLPHGFLTLSQLSKETREAANVCVERIRAVFTQKETPPEPRKHRKLERTKMGVRDTKAEDDPVFAGRTEGGEQAVGHGVGVADGEDLVAVAAQNNGDVGGIGAWTRGFSHLNVFHLRSEWRKKKKRINQIKTGRCRRRGMEDHHRQEDGAASLFKMAVF